MKYVSIFILFLFYEMLFIESFFAGLKVERIERSLWVREEAGEGRG